ncbi:hypothetical protein IMSHALPRED_009845 [Imshaugia aleurites]|uniref:Uncharacterized protein n=1 Tax=Imshaugia aleurites TaxID=172621 RepID=A0A8H3G4U4_9LECA|nr:hypothetical protein IMSHALPRED_009845 [Imshaugia aleurites]
MMFFNRVRCSSNVPSIHSKPIQQEPREEIRAQKLVEFLPMSIEGVKMKSKYVGKGLYRGDVVALFTDLPEQRHQLPKLFEIYVERRKSNRQSRYEKEGWKELCARCKGNDIKLYRKETDGGFGKEYEQFETAGMFNPHGWRLV